MDIKGTMISSSHLMHNTAQNSPLDSPLKPSTWQLDDTVAFCVISQNHLKVWLKGSHSITSLVGCEILSIGDSSMFWPIVPPARRNSSSAACTRHVCSICAFSAPG